VARLLRDLETYICGQSDIIIDYATARQEDEPTRIPDQTIGHRGVAVDFRARWRLEVSSVSRDPFYLLVLHAGRV
jgi:hypothetical protein